MRYHNPKTMTFDHLPKPISLSSHRTDFVENKVNEDMRKISKTKTKEFLKANPKALRIPNTYQ